MISIKATLALLAAVSATVLAERALFIIPVQELGTTSSCLSESFYGRYGRPLREVYISDSMDCFLAAADLTSSGSLAVTGSVAEAGDSHLVWLQDAGVEDALRDAAEPSFGVQMESVIARIHEESSLAASAAGDQQEVISPSSSSKPTQLAELLHLSHSSAIISVSSSIMPILDTFLPRFIVPVVLPSEPLANGNLPIPPEAVHRVQEVLAHLKFNPSIAAVVSGLSIDTLQKNVRWLTGENADSGIVSRHSFSSGSRIAADWIQGEVEKSGAVCEQRHFSVGFAPNVICRYPATQNTTATTILSAHYDSRGSFGSLRAPGGDDDGSGTSHILEIARVIKEKQISFKSHVELVLFAGEEQGLVGSRSYSRDLRKDNANITLHIQADMLAYREPNEPLQLGLPEFIGLPEVAFLVANMSKLYAPELTVGYTAACCSDHQSFHEQGFPATAVFERAGPIADPMYHHSGDVSNRTGYDFVQLQSIAKVTMASVLEVAGFDLVPVE